MGRKLHTYYAEPEGRGYCEVHFDFKEEYAYIKYFDEHGIVFYVEDFKDKSLTYVESAAENWALGHKKLEGSLQGSLFRYYRS